MARPAYTEPPGLLMYRLMSVRGSSADRTSSWEQTRLAETSSTWVPSSTMRWARSWAASWSSKRVGGVSPSSALMEVMGCPRGRRDAVGSTVDLGRCPEAVSLPVADSPPAERGPRGRSVLLAQLPEERPNVVDQQVRFLHRREVAAAVELGPAHQVLGAFRLVPQRDLDLGREDGEGGRRGRRFGGPGGPRARGVRPLVVDPGGRTGGPRKPVQHHVGQQPVPVHGLLGQLRGVG